jgi:CheY-like chemotaxis protein
MPTLIVCILLFVLRSSTGNIAHDLKTPLQSIVSELGSMCADGDTASLHTSVSSLQGVCSFMLMMINRSLDFVKVEAGVALVCSPSAVDVQEILLWAVNCVQIVSQTVPITLSRLPSNLSKLILTDKQWLEENILCLISNATKYTSAGSVDIRVSLGLAEELDRLLQSPLPCTAPYIAAAAEAQTGPHQQRPPQMILFEVEDSGIGLSDDQYGLMFTPGRQAERAAGGTGLGLHALARRVCAMGGAYGVLGRHDRRQGSRFWFTVPYLPHVLSPSLSDSAEISLCPGECWDIRRLSDADAGDAYRPRHMSCASDQSAASATLKPKSMNILVVEDSPLIQKTTKRILNLASHTVIIANNGAECLTILERGEARFDIILMDIQMPVLGGIDTVRRIRQMEAAAEKQCPQFVIGLSANSDDVTRQAALDAGMDDFLAKPLTIPRLTSCCLDYEYGLSLAAAAVASHGDGDGVDEPAAAAAEPAATHSPLPFDAPDIEEGRGDAG